jgi:hypothetical protein
VIGKDGLEKVFDVLRAPFTEEPTNWSRRYKANLEKLASGDVIKVSEVVRDLWRRDQDRGLSAGEKRMLAKARQILVSEIALALKADEDHASGSSTRFSRADPGIRRKTARHVGSVGCMSDPLVPVPHTAVIVVAAGSGQRLGAGVRRRSWVSTPTRFCATRWRVCSPPGRAGRDRRSLRPRR